MDAPGPPPPSAPRLAGPRRWPRRILLGVLLLVVAALLAPFYADPILRGLVVRRLAGELGAEVHLKTFDFSWPGRVRMSGLTITDEEGALASVQDLTLSVELPALLAGRWRGRAEVQYPEIHVRRTPQGSWNWEAVTQRIESAHPAAPEPSSGPGPAPDLRLDLALQEARIVLHGVNEETRIESLSAHLAIDGLERPAAFEASWRLRGPNGPGGSGSVSGEVTAAPEGRLGALEATGHARLEIRALDLAALAPVLDLFVPLDGAAGQASGSIDVQIGRGLALVGTTALELRDARLQGPIDAPPTRIGRLALEGRADLAADGTGTQHLEWRGDEWLRFGYDGETHVDDAGNADLRGTMTVAVALEPLVEATRSWIPFQPGVRVGGDWNQTLEIAAELRSRSPRSITVRTSGGLEDVSARDARGRQIDLSALARIALELEAHADLAEDTVRVSALHLELGPVDLRADGLAQAISTRPALRAGHATLKADLEQLRGTLQQVVALAPGAFGGRIEASGSAEGDVEALHVQGQVAGRGLVGAGVQLEILDGTLEGDWVPLGESRAAASLRASGLRLAREGEPVLEWPGLAFDARFARQASGDVTFETGLESADGSLNASCAGQGSLEANLDGRLVVTPRWSGRLDRLGERARAFVPELAPLAGTLEGDGEGQLTLKGGRPTRVEARLATRFSALGTTGADGTLQSLPGLSEATAELHATLDPATGTLDVTRMALRSEALRAGGSARLDAGAGGREPRFEEAAFTFESDLEALGQALATLVDLEGFGLGGGAVRAEGEIHARGTALDLRGHATAASLVIQRSTAPPLEQRDLHAAFDVQLDLEGGSLVVREVDVGSKTAQATLRGRLEGLDEPEKAQGELHLSLEGQVERLLTDLGLEGPGSGRRTVGRLRSRASLAGTSGAFRLEGATFVENFRLEVRSEVPEEAPLVIEEPRVELDLEADLALATLDVDVRRIALSSELVRGGAAGRVTGVRPWIEGAEDGEIVLTGWTGELVYVPDLLGAVLAPWLPGKLSGSEERRATLVFEGRARDLDVVPFLAGSRGHLDLALGKLVRPEIEMQGDLGLDLQDGRARVRGDLAANGGQMSLDGDLTLDGSNTPSTLAIQVRDLAANSGLAPLLAHVHPAFGGLNAARGDLGGTIGLSLNLAYDGPLAPEVLAEDWTRLPLEPLHGSGRLEIRGATLHGSPLLQSLAELGLNVDRALDVRPIEFTIERGRLAYARPWTWTLSGVETTFTGTMGLDQTLDLAWNVPITEALVKRWGFLQAMLGERIAFPLRGTVAKPRLETSGVLEQLAKDVAKKELGSRLGLGGGSSDPAKLLSDADRLWDEGKKAEAARIYKRLLDDFKLSLVYALNKNRIKDRARFPD